MIIDFPDPSGLSARELLKTYSTIKRLNHALWILSEDAPDTFAKRHYRVYEGLYIQSERVREAYTLELEKRTGIDRDPVWYEYPSEFDGDKYRDFIWLRRRLYKKHESIHERDNEFNRILESAGYTATKVSRVIDGFKQDWKFTGHRKVFSDAV